MSARLPVGSKLRFSVRRVGVIAGQAFQEAVRQRVFLFTTLLAALLVVGSLGLRELDFGGAELKFVADFGHGALVLFGSVLTIVTTVQLLGGELENRTVLPVLARPVRRSEFICGKFFGAWAVVLVFCATVTVLLLAVLWFREQARPVQWSESPLAPAGATALYAGVLVGGILQAVKFGLLTAMVLLIGSYAQTNLFAQAASFLVLTICHLQYLAHDAWRNGAGWFARIGGGAIGLLFPNFQLFGAEYSDFGAGGEWLLAGRVVLYGLVYAAAFLALAVWSFRHREI